MTTTPVVTKLPLPPRVAALKAALRDVDTSTLTTREVAEFCEAAVPGCTVPEIVAALRLAADEHSVEAEQLRQGAP